MRELAEVTGACYTSYMVHADSPIIQPLQEMGRKQQEDCKGDGTGHDHGPPWPHVLTASLTRACADGVTTTPEKVANLLED